LTFWDWALEIYARPGVEAACLELQDRQGQSVVYLLWTAWAVGEGRVLSDDVLKSGAGLAARWEAEVMSGLRQARRNMRSPFDGLDDGARETLRTKLKTLELEAEETLMLALERLSPEPSGAARELEPALYAAAAFWPSTALEFALRPLALALG
jgi:uncharacterized protein (TIGR02444 family)